MDYIDWLRQQHTERRIKNPAFSLRSFARALNVQPGRLSEILARKRPLTTRQLYKFAEQLSVPLSELERSIKGTLSTSTPMSYADISEEQFEVLANPVHFHIMSAMELGGYDGQPKWLARVLGVDICLVRAALERLQSCRLVKSLTSDHWQLVEATSTTASYGTPNAALRRAHRASIEHALNCLDDVPLQLRDISSITLAIDPRKIEKARTLIQKFRRKLASEVEVGNKSEVYELNVQLVPVSKLRSSK